LEQVIQALDRPQLADSANSRSNFQQTSASGKSRRSLRAPSRDTAAGTSGEATPKDSNTPQETLTIEASEPPNPEVNHE
jgi:hypothetical protein